jgi:hypothetical protein
MVGAGGTVRGFLLNPEMRLQGGASRPRDVRPRQSYLRRRGTEEAHTPSISVADQLFVAGTEQRGDINDQSEVRWRTEK